MVKLIMPKNYFHNFNIQNENIHSKKNYRHTQINQKEKVNINQLLNRVKIEKKNLFKKKLLSFSYGFVLISFVAILLF
jgi:hypothetical protein